MTIYYPFYRILRLPGTPAQITIRKNNAPYNISLTISPFLVKKEEDF